VDAASFVPFGLSTGGVASGSAGGCAAASLRSLGAGASDKALHLSTPRAWGAARTRDGVIA